MFITQIKDVKGNDFNKLTAVLLVIISQGLFIACMIKYLFFNY